MAEAIALTASNPFIQSLLVGIASSAAYDAIKKIIKNLCDHFERRDDLFESEDIKEMEDQFAGIFERYEKGQWGSVQKTFLEQFQQFLFPNRKIVFEHLDESQCEYIAERVFYGVSFQSMLVDAGYTKENVEYLFPFPSKYVGSPPYYFDIKATREYSLIDHLLVGRVVDSRALDPIDSLQAIPTRIREINEANPQRGFRDFDLYIVIHTGHYTDPLSMRIRNMLRNYNETRSDLPRFTYFTKEELDFLMKLKKEDRAVSLQHKLLDLKIYRGV